MPPLPARRSLPRQRGQRGAHRVAQHGGSRAARHARRCPRSQGQQVRAARQQPVGAAEHGVLLVQHHRRPAGSRQQPRRQHRRHGGVAAEAHHRRRVAVRASRRARLPACRPPAPARPGRPAQRPRPARPAPGSTMRSAFAKPPAVEGAGARVGHQRHALAARDQLGGQRLGRETGARRCRRRR